MADGETPGIGVMLGKGAEVPCDGRVWKLSPPDQNAKERLEKLAAARSLSEVERLQGILDPGAYSRAYASAIKQLPSYRTWGDGWYSVVFDAENIHFFLWSLLLGPQPGTTEEEAKHILSEAPEGVAAAYAQILPGFFQMLVADRVQMAPKEQRAELHQKVMEQVNPFIQSALARLGHIAKTST